MYAPKEFNSPFRAEWPKNNASPLLNLIPLTAVLSLNLMMNLVAKVPLGHIPGSWDQTPKSPGVSK